MPVSDAALNFLANHLFGADITVHLHTSATVGADGTRNRVSGGGYAGVVGVPAGWTDASDGDVRNAARISFALASAAWGTVRRYTLHRGSLYIGDGPLTETMVDADEVLELPAGSIVWNGSAPAN